MTALHYLHFIETTAENGRCANEHDIGLGLCENSLAVSMFGKVGQSHVAG